MERIRDTSFGIKLGRTKSLAQKILAVARTPTQVSWISGNSPHEASYDRVKIAFYDSLRQVAHGARLLGVSAEIAALAGQIEVPITDPSTIEGTVLLQGRSILVNV